MVGSAQRATRLCVGGCSTAKKGCAQARVHGCGQLSARVLLLCAWGTWGALRGGCA